jgi:hypothetical protein
VFAACAFCIMLVAVTSLTLDSGAAAGSESCSGKNSREDFRAMKKDLCYYAARSKFERLIHNVNRAQHK